MKEKYIQSIHDIGNHTAMHKKYNFQSILMIKFTVKYSVWEWGQVSNDILQYFKEYF